jgi:hypothetical protein
MPDSDRVHGCLLTKETVVSPAQHIEVHCTMHLLNAATFLPAIKARVYRVYPKITAKFSAWINSPVTLRSDSNFTLHVSTNLIWIDLLSGRSEEGTLFYEGVDGIIT